MGIYNRDYIRDERRGGGFGGSSGLWAIKYLLIANIAVFLLQNFNPRITDWLELRLGWRQEANTTAEPTPFFEVDQLRQGLPERLPMPDEQQPADFQIPPHSGVEPLAQYGEFSAVRWEDRYGLVETSAIEVDLRVDPARSLQLFWRLITYSFCHGGLGHIAFNMYALWLFGRLLEPVYGSREFLAIYLVGVVISGLGHLAFGLFQNSPAAAIGASGGVMAITFLCAMHYPRLQLLLMLIIPIELRWFAVMYAVVDVLGLLNPGSGVAHAAHLAGAAFGVAYKYYGWRLLPLGQSAIERLQGIRRRRRAPSVRIYNPADEALEARVDSILEKIHAEGEASLTDEERETLREASRRFRGR